LSEERKSDGKDQRPREPASGGVRDLVDRALEWLADVLAPAPEPVPVPVRVPSGGGRRRR
jgi:hypothetical protein